MRNVTYSNLALQITKAALIVLCNPFLLILHLFVTCFCLRCTLPRLNFLGTSRDTCEVPSEKEGQLGSGSTHRSTSCHASCPSQAYLTRCIISLFELLQK